jgi:hypothetical protein
MDVVDDRDARRAQEPPQRREERDPVDDLEHDVRVAPDATEDRPRRAREHRQPRPHPVDREAV